MTDSPPDLSTSWQLLLLSAPGEALLESATAELARYLRHHPEIDLGDVAFTLQAGITGIEGFDLRRMLVCRDVEDAIVALEGSAVGRLETAAGGGRERPVSFLLPGFGDHYPDMGLGLYRDQPVFRRTVDRCCDLLVPELGFDLRRELFPGLAGGPARPSGKPDLRSLVRGGGPAGGARPAPLVRMATVQSSVFVVEYALAELLVSWGIRPRTMIGYSLGEYTAACLAGVIPLDDCLTLVARRGRLIDELPGGAMLAVPLPRAELEAELRDGLGVAIVNGPALHVVSGPEEAVAALEVRLGERGVLCRRLAAHHAGHSPWMEPMAERLRDLVGGFTLAPPRIPFVSNVTGDWIRPEEATDPEYWVRHLCRPVLWSGGLERLLTTGTVLLEVGPGQALTAFAKHHPAAGTGQDAPALATLRSAYNHRPDRAFLLTTLGRLWMAGVAVDWAATHDGRRTSLPGLALAAGMPAPGHVHAWPKGLRIVCQGRTEADHFYQDIFEKEIYRRHGIELPPGATVFDVGANIGTFLLWVSQVSEGAQIYSFEPAPPLFTKLSTNAALNRVDARLFNVGLSDRADTAPFTFYPRSSGMSSFHADKEQEKAVLRCMIEREREAGMAGAGEVGGFAEELLEERFRGETFECPLCTLSEVIEEQEVEWIDLLKIDVQKAELQVLQGIREEHWPRIAQIVAEVHDLDGRLARIVCLLEGRGFEVAVEQDELLHGSVLHNLFARRPGVGPPAGARERQRQAFARSASPGPRPLRGVRHAAPGSDLERRLAEIWQRVLAVEDIGIDDDFFDLGGTSLSGLQVVREVRLELGRELSPVALFAAPTVRALARDLE